MPPPSTPTQNREITPGIPVLRAGPRVHSSSR